jgi:hypothetical protein
VVRRINRSIRDPRVKEHLIEKVEDGEDLQNSEAARVYPIDSEPGVGIFRRVVLTAHVQYRLDLRGITLPMIESVLKDFSQQMIAWKKTGNPAYDRIRNNPAITWVKGGLKLVFVIDGDDARIVTAYFKGSKQPAPVKCQVKQASRQTGKVSMNKRVSMSIEEFEAMFKDEHLLGIVATSIRRLILMKPIKSDPAKLWGAAALLAASAFADVNFSKAREFMWRAVSIPYDDIDEKTREKINNLGAVVGQMLDLSIYDTAAACILILENIAKRTGHTSDFSRVRSGLEAITLERMQRDRSKP